jgi:hypothetical protein
MVVYCATLFAMKQSFGTYIPVHLKQFLVLLFGAVSFVLMEVSLKIDSLLLKSDFKHSMIYGKIYILNCIKTYINLVCNDICIMIYHHYTHTSNIIFVDRLQNLVVSASFLKSNPKILDSLLLSRKVKLLLSKSVFNFLTILKEKLPSSSSSSSSSSASVEHGLSGLAIVNAMSTTGMLNWAIRTFTMVRSVCVCVQLYEFIIICTRMLLLFLLFNMCQMGVSFEFMYAH